MDACIVLQKKIRQRYTIKQEDKHFFAFAQMRLYQFTKESCLA